MTEMKIDIDNIEIPLEPIIKEEPKEPISKILSDENTTIENILNYPTILDEFISKNEDLIKYFTIDKIKILINYIIKEPKDDNFEKGHKYPFICSEILKLKIPEILNQFLNNDNENNNIELLDYLLSFIPNKAEDIKNLNYILCGYFSSTIASLLNYNPDIFLQYIYLKRKDILISMTKSNKKSILELLSQILFFEKYYLNNDTIKLSENNKNEYNKIRYDILVDIFKSIKLDMDNEELNSIYFFICKLFSSSNITSLKDIFKKIIDNRFAMKNVIYNTLYYTDLINYLENDYNKIENRRKNFIIIIDIIIFLLINIQYLKLELPSCNSTTDKKSKIKHTKISQEIFNSIERLIKINFIKRNLKEKNMLSSFNEYVFIPFGEYKIKIIELISNLFPYFSKISKPFDEILIKTNFFKYGFDYIFEYEWNNLYQEQFLNLFKNILFNSLQHELLIKHLFNDIKIFDLIKKYLLDEENNKFKFNNDIANNISRGYKAFLINLCYKINCSIGEPPIRQNINGSFEFRHVKNNNNDNNFVFGNMININIYWNFNNINNNNENILIDDNNIKVMEKYLNQDWNVFYKNNVLDLIKQYCDDDWPSKKKDNIFDYLFEDNEKKKNNDNNNSNSIETINKDENGIIDDTKKEEPLQKNENEENINHEEKSE